VARRIRTPTSSNQIEEIRGSITKLLDTPLLRVAVDLKDPLEFLAASARSDATNEEVLRVFLSQTSTILHLIPETFGDRFWFDAHMIAAIVDNWNGPSQRLSGTIVPKPASEWAHRSAYITVGDGTDTRKSINVIYVPGQDDVAEVDLLAYPWLCHELAHNLFFYNDSFFIERFKPELDKFLGSLRLRAIADHGSAKAKSDALIARIENFWAPTLTHQNWAHEMAMDIVALWTCGPAFLAAFQDEIEDKTRNPYHLDEVHPPYAVRAIGLLKASKELGWIEYARRIKELLSAWRNSQWAKQVDNNYLALTEPQLIEATVDCTIATCQSFSLFKCTSKDIQRIRELLNQQAIPSFGIDLIIAAWIAKEQMDDGPYSVWESSTIRSLVNSLTP
jgi:hypothetical protein